MANILVDTTITVVVFGSLYEGYRRGLVTTLLGLAGFTMVLLLSLAFGERLSEPFKPFIPLPTTYATLAAYIWICFAIAVLLYFVHTAFRNLLAKRVPPAVDAIGGMFAGAVRGGVFTALCLVILLLIASPAIHKNITDESRIGSAFFNQVRKVSPTVNDVLVSSPSARERKRVEKRKRDYEEVVESFRNSGGKKN